MEMGIKCDKIPKQHNEGVTFEDLPIKTLLEMIAVNTSR
jgi:hypothetical protein